MTSEYAYYPGCSLQSLSSEYDLSTRSVCSALGVNLVELDDWNCCGASAAHSLSESAAFALPARNLVLADKLAGKTTAVACAACYNRLRVAERELRDEPSFRLRVEKLFGHRFSRKFLSGETPAVVSTLEILSERSRLEQIRNGSSAALKNLRVVPYYGCMLVRPSSILQFDSPENPVSLDLIMEAAGANVLDWSYKTECCGASLTMPRADIVRNLAGEIMAAAEEAGADVVVTACPLCQSNLEMRGTGAGDGSAAIRPVYFTELLGLALGLPEAARWLNMHLVDPVPTLESAGVAVGAAERRSGRE